MKNMFSFLKPKKDIEFVDTKKMSYHNFSVERAVDVPTNTRKVQQDKYGKHLMPFCPGILDYAQFGYIIPAWVDIHHTTNFICMPKRECNVHIKAGDPLLHVIPFLNKDITASVGPATDEMIDKTTNLIPGDDKQYYRKFMGIKKKFNMQKEEIKQ